MENELETRILVENGDIFDGSREEFMNCFFSNADDEEISDWCFDQGYSLKIGNDVILT